MLEWLSIGVCAGAFLTVFLSKIQQLARTKEHSADFCSGDKIIVKYKDNKGKLNTIDLKPCGDEKLIQLLSAIKSNK